MGSNVRQDIPPIGQMPPFSFFCTDESIGTRADDAPGVREMRIQQARQALAEYVVLNNDGNPAGLS